MKKVLNDKCLNISQLKLTKEQLVSLFEIEVNLNAILSHDLNSPMQTLRNAGYLLSGLSLPEINKRKIESYEVDGIKKVLDELKTYIKMIIAESARASQAIQILRAYRPKSQTQLLVSKPYQIIQTIQDTYPEISIQIDKHSWRSLEVVYPENILIGLLQEFVYNAIKNIDKAAIFLSWKIEGSRIQFEIHDNGKGMIKDLGRAFIPLSNERSAETRQDRGLDIANKIISRSGGVLLFKRSSILGGTLVYFELPIYGYYKKGQIYDLSQTKYHK
jgi:signal transduction histidine kinase